MVDPESATLQVIQSWDTYWQGAGETGAYSSGGVNHPVILAFWEDFFHTVKTGDTTQGILDVASGSGAVIECALDVFEDRRVELTSLDVSNAAISNILNRFPGVQGLVADALSIPLDTGSFDIVTSQFGVEYAGVDAIDEAARLVAQDGHLALLLHQHASVIHQECTDNLDAVRLLQESRFVPYAVQMLAAGFEAVKGGDRALYELAASQLAPAVQAVDSIMAEYGEHVAGDTIIRLYRDVDRIHRNMQRYDPGEVLAWLGSMDGELDAYAGRMSSMCRSAIDNETFDQICTSLCNRGFTTLRAESLVEPEHNLPLAWVLVAANNSQQHKVSSARGADQVEVSPGNLDKHEQEELQKWIKAQVDSALKELMQRDAFDDLFVEAKPAWVLPFRVLIGRIRKPRDSSGFKWFICGELPTDHLGSSAASTPRDAARHFALQWQLEAARQQDSAQEELAQSAEALYELVEHDHLWPQQDTF